MPRVEIKFDGDAVDAQRAIEYLRAELGRLDIAADIAKGDLADVRIPADAGIKSQVEARLINEALGSIRRQAIETEGALERVRLRSSLGTFLPGSVFAGGLPAGAEPYSASTALSRLNDLSYVRSQPGNYVRQVFFDEPSRRLALPPGQLALPPGPAPIPLGPAPDSSYVRGITDAEVQRQMAERFGRRNFIDEFAQTVPDNAEYERRLRQQVEERFGRQDFIGQFARSLPPDTFTRDFGRRDFIQDFQSTFAGSFGDAGRVYPQDFGPGIPSDTPEQRARDRRASDYLARKGIEDIERDLFRNDRGGGGIRGGGGGGRDLFGRGGLFGRLDPGAPGPDNLLRGLLPGGRRAGFGALALGGVAALGVAEPVASAAAPLIPAGALLGAAGLADLAVATAAFHGMGKALEGDQKAFNALTPQAQAFVRTLRGFEPVLDKYFRNPAQQSLLPGLEKGLRSAATVQNFEALTNAAHLLGGALGSVGEEWGKAFGSTSFTNAVNALLPHFADWTKKGGDSLLNLAESLGKVMQAAVPFTDWMVKGIDDGSKLLNVWTTNAQRTGTLSKAFDGAKESIRLLWGLVKALSEALGELVIALAPVGKLLIQDLTSGLQSVARWVHENRQEIGDITTGALRALTGSIKFLLPILGKFWGILEDVVRAVGGWKAAFEALLALAVANWALGVATSIGKVVVGIQEAVTETGILKASLLGLSAPVVIAALAATATGVYAILHPDKFVSPGPDPAANKGTGVVSAKIAKVLIGDTKPFVTDVGPKKETAYQLGHGQLIGFDKAGAQAGKYHLYYEDNAVSVPGLAPGYKPPKSVADEIRKQVAASVPAPRVDLSGAAPTLAAAIKSLSPLGRKYGPEAAAAAEHYDIPTGLFLAQIKQESQFNPKAVSRDDKGNVIARGIAQFTPGTARTEGLTNPFDPATSLMAAAKLMADLYAKYHDWDKALAAYNTGTVRVDEAIAGKRPLPAETTKYVNAITSSPLAAVGAGASLTGIFGSGAGTGGTIGLDKGRRRLLDLAKQMLGTPYAWGGAGPGGFDCSGLVMWAFSQEGINIPHFTGSQFDLGVPVSRSDAQIGDVIFTGFGETQNGKKLPSNVPGHEGIIASTGPGGIQVIDAPGRGGHVEQVPLQTFTQGQTYQIKDIYSTSGAGGQGTPQSPGTPGPFTKNLVPAVPWQLPVPLQTLLTTATPPFPGATPKTEADALQKVIATLKPLVGLAGKPASLKGQDLLTADQLLSSLISQLQTLAAAPDPVKLGRGLGGFIGKAALGGGGLLKQIIEIASHPGSTRVGAPLTVLPGPTPAGLLERGNINLNNRRVAQNPDGSISTERSITITGDGRATLIPTVVGGAIVSDNAAIAHFKSTGQNLGTFTNEKAADAYAEKLHVRQGQVYGELESLIKQIFPLILQSKPSFLKDATTQFATDIPSFASPTSVLRAQTQAGQLAKTVLGASKGITAASPLGKQLSDDAETMRKALAHLAAVQKEYEPKIKDAQKRIHEGLATGVITSHELSHLRAQMSRWSNTITGAVSSAKQAVQAQQSQFSSIWGNIASAAVTAFNDQTSKFIPPSQVLINQLQDEQTKRQLQDALDQANKDMADALSTVNNQAAVDSIKKTIGQYTEAVAIDATQSSVLGGQAGDFSGKDLLGKLQNDLQAGGGPDPAAVASAQKELDDAQFGIRMHDLETNAQNEQNAWDSQRAKQQQVLDAMAADWALYYKKVGGNIGQIKGLWVDLLATMDPAAAATLNKTETGFGEPAAPGTQPATASSPGTIVSGYGPGGPIWLHAEGGVATRAMYAGPRDVVGEAGNEAWVPLDNPRSLAMIRAALTPTVELHGDLTALSGMIDVRVRHPSNVGYMDSTLGLKADRRRRGRAY